MTTADRTARLAELDLPDFGMPDADAGDPARALTPSDSSASGSGCRATGYDRLVVYADREHSANLSYLTGFDPRFEEALLIVGPTGDPAILVGNECWGMAGAAPLPMRRDLLPGPQPAEPAPRPLAPARRDPPRRGDRAGEPRRGRRLEDVRVARRRSRSPRSSSTRCASSSGASGLGRERRPTCSSIRATGCA